MKKRLLSQVVSHFKSGLQFLSLAFIQKFKKMFIWFFMLCLSVLALIFFCNWGIEHTTRKKVFDKVSEIPANKVGLLLGSIDVLPNGRRNLYFDYRIQATVELYKANKIQYIVASGDNHSKGYDEATAMKEALMRKGIPESAIYLDYAGFRTLDSVVRCHKVFGQKRFTIISQLFHNQRAVFIASTKGLETVGFNARNVSTRYGLKVMMREYLARVKAVLDIYVLRKKPKFLGPAVKVG
ncbi:MAG: SanA/YdcF family protein [Chitinophagales bacterium]